MNMMSVALKALVAGLAEAGAGRTVLAWHTGGAAVVRTAGQDHDRSRGRNQAHLKHCHFIAVPSTSPARTCWRTPPASLWESYSAV